MYFMSNNMNMPDQDNDKRLHDILDMIASIAALDFSKEIDVGGTNDMVAAIAVGLNMLSEELNTQVVDKAKLDEVNQKLEKFAYTTAHDLKSPLNSVSGLLMLLEHSTDPSNSEASTVILKLKKMNTRMKTLVEGILEYSRIKSKEIVLEKINLNELMNEVMETDNISNYADVEVPEVLPTVLFNRTAGVQVFRNLLNNAIKYCDKTRCKIIIKSKEFSDKYQIEISDNGPGIASEYHDKIFELFNQVNPKDESTGIGLAIVRNAIEASGGRIWLESEPDQGANFIFTLKKSK